MTQPLFEVVQDGLMRLIADERLRPGDALPSEGDLARRLGVSRGPVREATRSLQSIGVIEARAGRGLYLRDFSLESIVRLLPYRAMAGETHVSEVLELRAAVERGLIRQVAELVDNSQLVELDSIVDEMDRLEREGSSFEDADRRFHRAVYAVLGNSFLTAVLDALAELTTRMLHELPLIRWSGVSGRCRGIVRSLRGDGDPVAAYDAYYAYILSRVDAAVLSEET